MQSWDKNLGEYIVTPPDIENFLRALEGIMQVYDMSLFHEDTEGAFIIKRGFDKDSSKHLKEAMLEGFNADREEEKEDRTEEGE